MTPESTDCLLAMKSVVRDNAFKVWACSRGETRYLWTFRFGCQKLDAYVYGHCSYFFSRFFIHAILERLHDRFENDFGKRTSGLKVIYDNNYFGSTSV